MARPKLVTEVRTDELGEYTVYMNRVCTGPACGVVLTSRNQHRSTLMCKVHGRQKEQQQQHMLKLFYTWLKHANAGNHRDVMARAMDDYELRARLHRAMPQ